MTTLPPTQDPAVAIAMSRCLTARFVDPLHRVTNRHPKACGWCGADIGPLQRVVDLFNTWAEYDSRGVSARHLVRVFREQTRGDQLAQIEAAQELGNDLWGVVTAPTPLPGETLAKAPPPAEPEPSTEAPAPDVEEQPAEEVIAWMQ
jgi:hypothetical protein